MFFTETAKVASGSRSYIKEDVAVLSYDGQANSALAARAAPPNGQMKASWLPARKISNAGRNKSELSGRPLRGKQVFCEVRFQSLIYSHNKGGFMCRGEMLDPNTHIPEAPFPGFGLPVTGATQSPALVFSNNPAQTVKDVDPEELRRPPSGA